MRDLADLLVGRFVGTDDIHAGPWSTAQTAAVEVTTHREVDGAVLLMRMHERRESGAFDVLNLFMPDQVNGDILLYSFDPLGYPPDPPARGRVRDGTLVLSRSTERGHSMTVFEATPTGLRWAKRFRPSEDVEWRTTVAGTLDREQGTRP
jgi:hypothetical protein